MEINYIAAIIGGVAGTAVMTAMMLGGRRLHLPVIDAHGILGFMRTADSPSPLGYLIHFANGILFALAYALVFELVPANIFVLGIGLGILHWLAVGWMFALAPKVHAGMQAGTVQPTGPYMLHSLGITGFVAGTVGHIAFGLVVALTYWLYAI